MEDKKIIRLLFDRAEAGLELLARRYGQRLLSLARNILGSLEDAQESVSDTYLALWNAIPPNQPDPLAAFVLRTGRNQALKKYRYLSAARRDSRYDLSLEELGGSLAGISLEEELEVRQLGRGIDSFLHTLNKENRALFLRRYWFGDPIGELAKHFDLSENAVTVRLSRIRSKLKHYLIKEGFVHEGQIN